VTECQIQAGEVILRKLPTPFRAARRIWQVVSGAGQFLLNLRRETHAFTIVDMIATGAAAGQGPREKSWSDWQPENRNDGKFPDKSPKSLSEYSLLPLREKGRG